jgi:ABC-type transport system involved in multi-copper enzyme maturation permease subunit
MGGKKTMWLVTTMIAAIITTAAWYFIKKDYKLNILSLMLWGTSIMILVDHILGYEGGSFLELETDGLVTNATLLGIIMLIPVFILWVLVLLIKKPKIKIEIGGN